MKKIVIVGPAHPLRGGIAAFNERLAHQLITEGHQVTIFTFRYQYPNFLFPGKTQYSTDPGPEKLDIRVRIHSLHPFNWFKTANEILALEPDHVILRFWLPFMAPCLGTIGRRIKRKKKIRITGLVDNAIPHEKRPGDEWLIKYFTGTCDDFMTMSHQVTDDLKKFTDKPCRFHPHPIYDQYGSTVTRQEAAQTLSLPENERYLLFFGLVRKYKGLDLLLEAFAASEARHSYKLIIAGEFYDKPEFYEEIIRKNQLQDRIILHNRFIPDNEVKYYFSISDLITQTYRTATQSGISQIAYHFEKPMLITRVGGLGETVIDGVSGLSANPTVADITTALDRFAKMKDHSLFTPGIQAEKRKYQWPAFTAALLQTSSR
jgi:glycosyltransferase involved in cell wall biosynthesis